MNPQDNFGQLDSKLSQLEAKLSSMLDKLSDLEQQARAITAHDPEFERKKRIVVADMYRRADNGHISLLGFAPENMSRGEIIGYFNRMRDADVNRELNGYGPRMFPSETERVFTSEAAQRWYVADVYERHYGMPNPYVRPKGKIHCEIVREER